MTSLIKPLIKLLMSDYVQPEFYRFNEDSLKLVHWVCSKRQSAAHILDLGAGCGVIGIEAANRLRALSLTLVELQNDYLPFLQVNTASQLNSHTQSHIHINSFGDWQPPKKYDLILCNPPYFLKGHGEPSQDLRKYQARTFAVDSWKRLVEVIHVSLSKDGQAYLVVKNDSKILASIAEFQFKIEIQGPLAFLELSGLNKD
jgi:tRNA1Val (adenine37-N6)-methyltransferase